MPQASFQMFWPMRRILPQTAAVPADQMLPRQLPATCSPFRARSPPAIPRARTAFCRSFKLISPPIRRPRPQVRPVAHPGPKIRFRRLSPLWEAICSRVTPLMPKAYCRTSFPCAQVFLNQQQLQRRRQRQFKRQQPNHQLSGIAPERALKQRHYERDQHSLKFPGLPQPEHVFPDAQLRHLCVGRHTHNQRLHHQRPQRPSLNCPDNPPQMKGKL